MKKKYLLTPGPVEAPQSVLEAASRQLMSHRCAEFSELFKGIAGKLHALLESDSPVVILPSSGTGALECAAVNFLRRGDKFISLSCGVFGDRFREIAARTGARGVYVDTEAGSAPSPAAAAAALRENPDARAILVTHNETSTGVTNPLEVTHSYRAVINPTSATPAVSNIVTYAGPRATKNTGIATVYVDTNEGATVNSTTVDWEGRFTITGGPIAGTSAAGCTAASNLLMKISGRGNYTWTLAKKPYKFSLDKKANLCGMGEAKKWALVANHYDRSLLRNTVAMKMAQGLDGLAYTPDSVPVDVYVNGSYQGQYTLMERVNIGTNRVEIDELKNNQTGANNTAPNITGGYLLEWDFRQGGDHNFAVGGSGWVAIKEPEDETDGSGITSAQINYISNYVTQADTTLFSSSFADPTNGWRKYIDEKSLIDYYIVQELTKNLDANLYTSVHMYKTRDKVVNGVTVPGKLYFGPVWDFDTSMGSALYPGNQGTTTGWYLRNQNSAIQAKQTSETWFNRLFADPTFAAAVSARWKVIYPKLMTTDAFIASQIPIITTSANTNFTLWNINERLETEQVIKGSWSAEVSSLRSWISQRLAWMNSQLG